MIMDIHAICRGQSPFAPEGGGSLNGLDTVLGIWREIGFGWFPPSLLGLAAGGGGVGGIRHDGR